MPAKDPETETASPTPIFVLGLQRSGTTWISNVLCASKDVAGVEARKGYGIKESIFFSHFARAYGDLDDDEAFRVFAADFVASDYFIHSGLEESWFLARRPRSYAEAFRAVMNELARRSNARAWVEKSPRHTLLADSLAAAFPDARFVCVRRKLAALIRSRLWLEGPPPRYPRRLGVLLRACAAHALYTRTMIRFSKRCPRSVLIDYEEMSRDPENVCRRVTKFLGLDFDIDMLEPRYPPNTSFGNTADRRRALGPVDRIAILLFGATLRLLPLGFLERLEAHRREAAGIDWPDWCWTLRARPSKER